MDLPLSFIIVKILALPKMETFSDDKFKVTQNIKFVFREVENIVGKGENVGYKHFLLLPQCFQKVFLLKDVTQFVGMVIRAWTHEVQLNGQPITKDCLEVV